jgi:hypothetical protein
MRPLLIVAIDEGIEARLLLQHVRGRGLGGFLLQGSDACAPIVLAAK